MEQVEEVEALLGHGLKGDRYASAEGSYNKGKPGNRQVTLINAQFFEGSGFEFYETRRNIVTAGVELMWAIGREFDIGKARFRGVKYCEPCARPSKLSGNGRIFSEAFSDRGGLVAEVIRGGLIATGDFVERPPRG